ncbi:unnamed protein product, partial [Adineta steineri]
ILTLFSSIPKTSFTFNLILLPEPPSSISSELQANFCSLTIPSLTKTENLTCSSRSLSANQEHLNMNLSQKLASTIKTDSTSSLNEFSKLLSSAESTNNLQKSSSNNKVFN